MATDPHYTAGTPSRLLHEMPSGRTLVEECQAAAEVKAKPIAVLIQPNVLSGAGIAISTYVDCTTISFYLLREDGAKEWLSDLNKSNGQPSKDFTVIHCKAAKYSMEYGVPILPFNQVD